MADDKLIFPIGFDLEAAVKNAGDDWDKKYAKQLESIIAKRPFEIKAEVKGFDELGKSIDTLNQNFAKLTAMLTSYGRETTVAQQEVTNSVEKQGQAVANTTNTIQRQLMVQERVNKTLRDSYTEQERVKTLLDQYHDTYEGQVRSLTQFNYRLSENKKAQGENEKALKSGSITFAEYSTRQIELISQQRLLTQQKSELTQIMRAEEKAMLAQEGSYDHLSQQLSLLKKAYKELSHEGKASQFGQELEIAIQNLDAHLKDMAADMGEFQRNVGNYAVANANIRKDLKELVLEIANLSLEYQKLNDAEKQSESGQAIAERISNLTTQAGVLKDTIADTNAAITNAASDTQSFDRLGGAIQLAIDGFGLAQGAAAMLGINEEELAKIQTKLQAAIAASNSMSKIQNALQKQSALMQGVNLVQTKLRTAAENIHTAAKGKGIIATKAATAAQWAFNAAANANPIGLVVVAIVACVAAIYGLVEAFKAFLGPSEDATKACEDMITATDRLTKANEALIDSMERRGESYAKIHTQIINNLQQEYEQMKKVMDYAETHKVSGSAYEKASEQFVKSTQNLEDRYAEGRDFFTNMIKDAHEEEIEAEVGEFEARRMLINREYEEYEEYANKILALGNQLGYSAAELLDWDAISKRKQRRLAKVNEDEAKAKRKLSENTTDTRLQNLNEIEQTLTKINQKYEELLKKEGQTKALADIQKIYGDTLDYINTLGKKFKLNFAMPTDFKTLQDYRKAILKVIETLKMKGYEKAALELQTKIETGDVDQLSKQIEQKLKKLSDRISRTKTAREFYDRILAQTGDVEMAGTLTMNVYGEGGEDLFNNTVKLLQEYFSGVEVELPINFATQQIDYKALRKIWESDKALPKEMRKIPEAYDSAIKQMLDSADSANQKMIEGWLKATEKAKTYSDKLLDLARTTQHELSRIDKERSKAQLELGNLLAVEAPTAEQNKRIEHLRDMLEVYDELRERFNEKQAKEQTSLAYEAFKDSPMYVQMFDNLDNASTRMLENMRERLIALRGEWRNLDPTQLKEMQSRLNEIDAQLAKRNPFKTLARSISDYQKLSKNGSKESADDALVRAEERRAQAEAMLKEAAPDSEDAKFWQQEYEAAEAAVHDAEKVVENWKKVEDSIKLSANELFQMLNWAGDIAKAVADISEVLGADEEDVQYWNTVADSLGQIAGGIQDIVSAAMSLNVVSLISSVLTAVPKMFVGFVNLFNAGKIRDANKEIKKQAELLERLEYTYSRLEKEAEKVFGTDYIANYNRQLKILNAQAEAYRKQAAAERDKGKKADKEKIKEYENAARDTMNNIADMQGQLIEKFTGMSRYDVAKQMAQSWFDARVSMSDTFAAIKSDYKDMIKNMIVEGAAARIIEQSLAPMWENVDRMLRKNDIDGAIDALIGGMDKALGDANRGMEVLWNALEARGYDIKQLIGDVDTNHTGIKRDIASASEETMSNVAAIGNTMLYYVGTLPGISADVAAIRQAIERGLTPATATSDGGGWTDWEQQAMSSYLAIQRNTAETVVECRRAAVAAENAVTQLKRVITNNPSNTNYGVKVFA